MNNEGNIVLNGSQIINYLIMSLLLISITWTGSNLWQINKEIATLSANVDNLKVRVEGFESRLNEVYTQKEAEREFNQIQIRLTNLEKKVYSNPS